MVARAFGSYSRGVAARIPKLAFQALTAERWSDCAALFGERGACGGCWCMNWRLGAKEFRAGKGARNERAFKRIVERGAEPGVLAYSGERPIGWCSVAPRSEFDYLARSRVLKPVDAAAVWSITCLFVDREFRGAGLAAKLADAAAEHARSKGARIVEAYPVEPWEEGRMPAPFAWVGVPAIFERAGFREVARGSKARPILRRALRAKAK